MKDLDLNYTTFEKSFPLMQSTTLQNDELNIRSSSGGESDLRCSSPATTEGLGITRTEDAGDMLSGAYSIISSQNKESITISKKGSRNAYNKTVLMIQDSIRKVLEERLEQRPQVPCNDTIYDACFLYRAVTNSVA